MNVRGLVACSLICLILWAGTASAVGETEGTLLTALHTGEPVVIDGLTDETSWKNAQPLIIQVKDGTIGTVDVEVKALYDEENIYLYAKWPDSAENASKGVWTYNATTGNWTTSQNEDRIAFMWNINDSISSFNIAGCIVTCHGDQKHTEHAGEEADMWHWKASRTNPVGYCDDKFMNSTLSPYEDQEDKVVARYGDDALSGGYIRNIGSDNKGPRYYEPSPSDDRDAMFLLHSEIDNGEAVEVTRDTVFEDGAMVPGYILERPTGSRGDILAAGVWRDGYWGVEFQRRLSTGHSHDVQFDTSRLYRFGIAVMDNTGGFESHGNGHSFEIDARTLEFGGTGAEEVAQLGLVRDYLTTAGAYAARGESSLASSQMVYALDQFTEIGDTVALADPSLYILMREGFTHARRSPTRENIDELIHETDLMILTLQGKRSPPQASLAQRMLVAWGGVQPYVFIFLALMAIYPFYRTVQIGRRPVFRKMGIFLLMVITPVFLEGLGRVGIVMGLPFLYWFSFMTSEYATFLWACLIFIALFYARAGFGEVDRSIEALEGQRRDLAEAVENLQHEVAERVRTEEALKESEERYRTFVQGFHGVAYRADLDFKPVFFHGAVEEITGYTEDELLADRPGWKGIVHPDDRSVLAEIPSPSIKEVPRYSGEREYRIIRKDGQERWVHEFIQNLCDDTGKPVMVQGAIYDVTQRQEAEEARRLFEERFRNLFENSRDAVYTTSKEGILVDFNDSLLELFGYTREEMEELAVVELYVDPEDRARFQAEIEKTGAVRDYEVRFKKKDGAVMDCLLTSSVWTGEKGVILGYQGTIRDITERKRSEEALKRSKEFVETVLNSIQDALSIINVEDMRVVGVNKVFLEQLGMKEEEVIGKLCHEITHHRSDPCCPPNDTCPLTETVRTGGFAAEEHIHFNKDGERLYVEVSTSPIRDESGKVVQVVHVARDITERKEAEEEIRKSLKEKEILLKEIHHRVKNNMQVISSLLKLQSRHASDDKHRNMFRESQERIKSMALIHEQLYRSKDLSNVDFNRYLQNLIDGLKRSYGIVSGRIAIDIDVAGDIPMGVDVALPCGLIINELVSNSLKYAFPDGMEGRISISLRKDGDSGLVLAYRDSGVGIPEDFDIEDSDSLGLWIVRALVDELDGNLEIKGGKGTTFKVRFPETKE